MKIQIATVNRVTGQKNILYKFKQTEVKEAVEASEKVLNMYKDDDDIATLLEIV